MSVGKSGCSSLSLSPLRHPSTSIHTPNSLICETFFFSFFFFLVSCFLFLVSCLLSLVSFRLSNYISYSERENQQLRPNNPSDHRKKAFLSELTSPILFYFGNVTINITIYTSVTWPLKQAIHSIQDQRCAFRSPSLGKQPTFMASTTPIVLYRI